MPWAFGPSSGGVPVCGCSVLVGLDVDGLVTPGDVVDGPVEVDGLVEIPLEPVEPVEPVELLELPELCAWAAPAANSAAMRNRVLLESMVNS